MQKFIVKYLNSGKEEERIIEAQNMGKALEIFFDRRDYRLKLLDLKPLKEGEEKIELFCG